MYLVFTCIYLIKCKFDLNANLFPKMVIVMPITLKFLKTLQPNLTLNNLPNSDLVLEGLTYTVEASTCKAQGPVIIRFSNSLP